MYVRTSYLFCALLATACGQVASDAFLASENNTPNLFDEGFSIKLKQDTADIDADQNKQETVVVAEDSRGNKLAEGVLEKKAELSLDQGNSPEGEVIFAWPKSSEVINRDFNRLGALMVEYSKLVGTLLHRAPKGPGEEKWAPYIRSEQHRSIDQARSSALASAKAASPLQLDSVTKAWCGETINQLVHRLVPRGSEFRQYGNCGEGGIIGACLAKRSGFNEQEIRLCLSANDHFFGMVYRGKEGDTDHKWCIMDRWDLIGNFSCGVDLDDKAHQVTQNGKPVDQDWFKRAACVTLDKYLVDPSQLHKTVGAL